MAEFFVVAEDLLKILYENIGDDVGGEYRYSKPSIWIPNYSSQRYDPKDITPGYLPVEPVFEQYLKKNQNLQWVFLL